MCSTAIEHNIATFSELSLAVCWKVKLINQRLYSINYNVKLLTQAVTGDNLVENVIVYPIGSHAWEPGTKLYIYIPMM